jgi:hypothetical protein
MLGVRITVVTMIWLNAPFMKIDHIHAGFLLCQDLIKNALLAPQ